MILESYREILEGFLKTSLSNSDAIFEKFASLPGAVYCKGKRSLQRFVYVPGSKKNRVVLVAHADTVWDAAYGRSMETSLLEKDGVYYSANSQCGIGADDRAGCAMLWALRDCGHSLLLVDGEERGKHGARYLRGNLPLFLKLNRHRFMIELDWPGSSCSFNQVDNTPEFKEYILSNLELQESRNKGGCDLQILCFSVCGVNVGVGYHNVHGPNETLNLGEWENTLAKLSSFLQQAHPRFSIPLATQIRFLYFLGRGYAGRILRRLGIKKK